MFLTNPLMKSIMEQILYWNVDKWEEKLLLILQGISHNKWAQYVFQVENRTDKVLGQELTIYFQYIINCLRFLMGYPGFERNQIYQSSYIYN